MWATYVARQSDAAPPRGRREVASPRRFCCRQRSQIAARRRGSDLGRKRRRRGSSRLHRLESQLAAWMTAPTAGWLALTTQGRTQTWQSAAAHAAMASRARRRGSAHSRRSGAPRLELRSRSALQGSWSGWASCRTRGAMPKGKAAPEIVHQRERKNRRLSASTTCGVLRAEPPPKRVLIWGTVLVGGGPRRWG